MKAILPIAAFAAMLGASGAASAHAMLVSEEPAAKATVAAPAQLSLTFSEEIAATLSGVSVTPASGAAVAVAVALSGDSKTLTATPSAPLAPGSYTVSWHAVASDDGHKTHGSYVFTVK